VVLNIGCIARDIAVDKKHATRSPRQLLTIDHLDIVVGMNDVQAGIRHIDKLSGQKRVLLQAFLFDKRSMVYE
jgi:hypothetical protein